MCTYRVRTRTDGRTDGSLHLCLAFWCLAFYRGIGSLFASLSRARSWVSQCERTMSTRVCYVYAGYANELSILINPKLSSKPMCLCIFFLELRTQHFLRGRVSTYRSRHLSLCIFQACRPRPLPLSLSLPPSVTGRLLLLLPCLRLCLLRYLSKSVRRASPTSTGFLPIATAQTDRRGAQPEFLLSEQKGIDHTILS